ncbi:hypothetical protein [Flavobacterium sp.]|uniref:hypothetical protein n=1 Tax=Flavobacterium sp. TaxID=239 RepID=UPI002615F4EA|nr:hypothetical protein [Flavobacterium sp.]
MRKAFFFVAFLLTFSSCSKDEIIKEVPVSNYMKVILLQTSTTPGQPSQYFVEYGTALDDKVRMEISQAVFNYYESLAIQSPNPRWRGPITQ